jgi:hypothetical protein
MMKHHKDGKSTSESRDVREFFGQTRKKPEPDDKPRRVPKDKNSGTSVAKRLAGKVIG